MGTLHLSFLFSEKYQLFQGLVVIYTTKLTNVDMYLCLD